MTFYLLYLHDGAFVIGTTDNLRRFWGVGLGLCLKKRELINDPWLADVKLWMQSTSTYRSGAPLLRSLYHMTRTFCEITYTMKVRNIRWFCRIVVTGLQSIFQVLRLENHNIIFLSGGYDGDEDQPSSKLIAILWLYSILRKDFPTFLEKQYGSWAIHW
jgi:hypothetical protein